MVKKTAAAAAAAECHYQSGRYSQAAIEIEQCRKEEEERLSNDVDLIKLSRRGGTSEGSPSSSSVRVGDRKDVVGNEREIIILATDNDEDENINADSHDDVSSQNNDKNIVRVELIALSSSAHRADLAMCQFRSARSNSTSSAADDSAATPWGGILDGNTNDGMSEKPSKNNDTSPTIQQLWKRAKQTNREYRSALQGAAISLVSTASTLQQLNTVMSNGRQYESIGNAMKSTVLAILMAGVAASHLYLCQSDIDVLNAAEGLTNGHRYVTNGNGSNAWKVLVNSAALAADLMMARREFLRNCHDDAMDDGVTDVAKETSAAMSLLEESLVILNDTLLTNALSQSNNGLEKERDVMAMQSFRTALKVAALTCGKIILPTVEGDTDKAMSSSTSQEPQKKRQKSQEVATSTTVTNVWSVKYTTHFNPILHCRERIVDALSFHYASTKYSCDEAKLRSKRTICLEEGMMWEEQSNSGLFGKNDALAGTGGDDGWCTGYAWKTKHCLEGLDVVSSLSSSHQLPSSTVEESIRSLEMMAHSSRFACDLLGCIHARRGDMAQALEMFQSSLECTSSDDSNAESAQRRTIVNMSLCFLALGEANTPLELLLHLWMSLSGSSSLVSGPRLRSAEMLLTSDSAKVGTNNTAVDKSVDNRSRDQLLWMLFYASSLSQDWATCLNCTEEIMKAPLSTGRDDNHTVISRVFALLQCRRPSTAQELICNIIPILMTIRSSSDSNSVCRFSAELLLVVAQLYNVDAYLLQERSLDPTGGKDNLSNFIQCTNKSLSTIVPQVEATSPLWIELQIVVANNQGIALIVEGDSVRALGCFRKATQLLQSRLSNDRKGLQHLPWLLIPTFFNLSLVLLRDGHLEESARSWLLARKYLPYWEKAIRGDIEALKKLRDFHTVAINRHVILMAKRTIQREAAVWDQENIMEWVPPSFESVGDIDDEESSLVCGVDASQVIALDVILLRYAISFAEKKAAASFRRSAGSIGY